MTITAATKPNPSTNACGVRRGLVRFSLPGVPSNMAVYSATLTLTILRGTVDTVNGTTYVAHKLASDWGEGTASGVAIGTGRGQFSRTVRR